MVGHARRWTKFADERYKSCERPSNSPRGRGEVEDWGDEMLQSISLGRQDSRAPVGNLRSHAKCRRGWNLCISLGSCRSWQCGWFRLACEGGRGEKTKGFVAAVEFKGTQYWRTDKAYVTRLHDPTDWFASASPASCRDHQVPKYTHTTCQRSQFSVCVHYWNSGRHTFMLCKHARRQHNRQRPACLITTHNLNCRLAATCHTLLGHDPLSRLDSRCSDWL